MYTHLQIFTNCNTYYCFSCRAFELPFYIGTVAPFVLIYIFNWVVFVIIIISLMRKQLISRSTGMKSKTVSFFKQQLVIALALSLLFGLGWGIGLLATQGIYNNQVVRDSFAAIFVVANTFHGFFIFIMHSLRSKEVRSTWKRWFFGVTRKDFDELSTSTFNRVRRKTSHDATRSTIKSPAYTSSEKGGKASVFSFSDSDIESGGTIQHNVKKHQKEAEESIAAQDDTIVVETVFTKSFPDEEINEKKEIGKKEEIDEKERIRRKEEEALNN